MKHLAIIAFGCSGTNAIVDHLFNNSSIWVHDNKEPLNIKFLKANKNLMDKSYDWYEDHLLPMIENAEKENKLLLIHIKPGHFTDNHLTLKEGIDTLKEKFDFITIKRNNYISKICSGEVKKVAKTSSEVKKIKIGEMVKSFFNALHRMDIINDIIPIYISPNKWVHIDYETEINKDVRAASDKVTKFYGIYENYNYEKKRFNFHAQKNKWSDIPLKDKIENWEEIVEALRGTKYEWMLEG